MGTKFIKGLEGRDVKVKPFNKKELILFEHDITKIIELYHLPIDIKTKKMLFETARQVKIQYMKGFEVPVAQLVTRWWFGNKGPGRYQNDNDK